jgi:C4-dicarboxylate transporter DctM subunit
VPVIVLGGLYGGVVTLTECAALSAVVAILLSVFVYKGVKPGDLLRVTAEAIRNAASIMIIIALALVFGHWVTETGVTMRIVAWATDFGLEWWQYLMAVNVLLMLLGMFLEVFSVLLLTMPVLLPLLQPLGIDPVHFGVVVTMNMEIALLTPPVGLNLFVMAGILRCPLSEVVRGIWPFLILMFILLLMVTYIPALSLFLPNLVYG